MQLFWQSRLEAIFHFFRNKNQEICGRFFGACMMSWLLAGKFLHDIMFRIHEEPLLHIYIYIEGMAGLSPPHASHNSQGQQLYLAVSGPDLTF